MDIVRADVKGPKKTNAFARSSKSRSKTLILKDTVIVCSIIKKTETVKMKPLPVNMLAFESAILKCEKPVLVVFGAMWDRGSRTLFALLEEYGEKLDGKLVTAKADFDYVPEIFCDYNIQEVPTMIVFDGGEPFKPYVGYHGFDDIDKYLYSFYGYLPYKPLYAEIDKYS